MATSSKYAGRSKKFSTPEEACERLLQAYHIDTETRGRHPLKARMCEHFSDGSPEGVQMLDMLRRHFGWKAETLQRLADEGSLGCLLSINSNARLSFHYQTKALARPRLELQVDYQFLGGKDEPLLWRADKIKDSGPVFVVLGENDLIGCADCDLERKFGASLVALPYNVSESDLVPDFPVSGRQVFILPPQRKRERTFLENVCDAWRFNGVAAEVLNLWSEHEVNAALSNAHSRYGRDPRRLVGKALAIGQCLK